MKAKQLKPDQEAITPRGHRIVCIRQTQRHTIVKEPGWKDEIAIPHDQEVTPVGESDVVQMEMEIG